MGKICFRATCKNMMNCPALYSESPLHERWFVPLLLRARVITLLLEYNIMNVVIFGGRKVQKNIRLSFFSAIVQIAARLITSNTALLFPCSYHAAAPYAPQNWTRLLGLLYTLLPWYQITPPKPFPLFPFAHSSHALLKQNWGPIFSTQPDFFNLGAFPPQNPPPRVLFWLRSGFNSTSLKLCWMCPPGNASLAFPWSRLVCSSSMASAVTSYRLLQLFMCLRPSLCNTIAS